MFKSHRSFVRAGRTTAWRAPLTAIAFACVLAACADDGTSLPASTGPSTNSNSGGGSQQTTNSQGTQGTVTTVGKTATDLGSTIAAATIPGVSPGVTQGLGNSVGATGSVIDSAANALASGLGQTGTISDPVGTTAAGLGSTVSSTSGVIAGAAAAVDALGTGNLSALSPVTTPTAGALYTVANGFNAAGQILGSQIASPAVQQVTQPVSGAITPLVITVGQTTQAVGTTTGLGAPAASLLGQIGGAVKAAGAQLSSTTSPNLLGGDLGQLVTSVGNTVANAGGLVDPQAPNGVAPIPGLITSLVGSSNTAVPAGTASSTGSSASLPLLGGLLGSSSSGPRAVTSPIGGGSAGGSNPLGGLTSAVGSLTGSAAGGGSSVGGVLGSLLGNGLPLGKLP
jgi:hypothetical protein